MAFSPESAADYVPVAVGVALESAAAWLHRTTSGEADDAAGLSPMPARQSLEAANTDAGVWEDDGWLDGLWLRRV